MKPYPKVLKHLQKATFAFIGILIIALSIIVFSSVIGRYFFSSPLKWAFDSSIWFTGMIAFVSGGYVLYNDQHVRVDLLYEKLSPRLKSVIDLITALFIILMVLAFVWVGYEQTLKYYLQGSKSSSGLNIYLWIQWLMIPVGGILLGIQVVFNVINDIYCIITGNKLWGVSE